MDSRDKIKTASIGPNVYLWERAVLRILSQAPGDLYKLRPPERFTDAVTHCQFFAEGHDKVGSLSAHSIYLHPSIHPVDGFPSFKSHSLPVGGERELDGDR